MHSLLNNHEYKKLFFGHLHCEGCFKSIRRKKETRTIYKNKASIQLFITPKMNIKSKKKINN